MGVVKLPSTMSLTDMLRFRMREARAFRVYGQMPSDQMDLRPEARERRTCQPRVARSMGLSEHDLRCRLGLASDFERGVHQLTGEVLAYKGLL